MSVRLRPGVLIDNALANALPNALAGLALRSRTRQVSIANAAPAETAIPAGSRGPEANVHYVRPRNNILLSPDISVLVYRGQYAGPVNPPGLAHRGAWRADARLFDPSCGRTTARRTDRSGRAPGGHADEGRTGAVNADRANRVMAGREARWRSRGICAGPSRRWARRDAGQAPLRRRRRRISYSCTIA